MSLIGINLSGEQKAAIMAGGGLVRVISGAGTGKTTVLTHRAAWLVDQGTPANKILAVSFTKAAAREISQRAALLRPGADAIHGSTIHGLAARILRGFTDRLDLGPKWGIIDDDAALPLLRRVMIDFFPIAHDKGFDLGAYNPSETPDKSIISKLLSNAMPIIQSWKERMLNPEAVIGRYSDDPYGSSSFFAELYGRYQTELKSQDLMEISDLIPNAVNLLDDNSDLESIISHHFYNILVDEFQDVNIAQVRFLNILGGRRHMTIVGDDDQSIYMFRHSIPNAMRLAPKLLSDIAIDGVRDFSLVENRRSTQVILDKANILVDYNPRSSPKILKSDRSGEAPKAMSFATDAHEAASIVKKIETLIDGGNAPKSIAILGRSASVMNSITARLAARKVPHRVVSGMRFTERRQIRDLMAWSRLSINPACHISFARASSAPTCGIGPAALHTIRNCAESLSINYIEAIRYCVTNKLIKNSTGADHMADQIENMSIMADDQSVFPSKFFNNLINEIGYISWLEKSKDGSRQAISIVKIFIEMAKSQENADDKYNLIKFMDDVCLSEDPGEAGKDAVTISSIHKSKGCEWDHVFIIGMEEGLMPHHKSASVEIGFSGEYDIWSDTAGCIEEERRLLHVAMTRAKKTVILSTAKMRAFSDVPQRESSFLKDMNISVHGDRNPHNQEQERQNQNSRYRRMYTPANDHTEYSQESGFNGF